MAGKIKTGFSLNATTCASLHALSFVLGKAQSSIVEDGVADVVTKLTAKQRDAYHAARDAISNR